MTYRNMVCEVISMRSKAQSAFIHECRINIMCKERCQWGNFGRKWEYHLPNESLISVITSNKIFLSYLKLL